jgi:prepilin-type N-terminal cleavage/methylation domain-containing protein
MTRLRNDDGFTLMEVITAMTVGLVLLSATLGLLESTVRLNTGVMAKTDAMQRGRLGMDTITQQLRSQVCFDWDHSAIVPDVSDKNSVTFYADYSANGSPPVKRTIRFDEGTGRIVSLRYDPPSPLPDPFTPANYAGAPNSTNLVLENVVLQRDPADQTKTIPFLRYYAYQDTAGVLRADQELIPPLDDAEAARAARVEINFVSRPTGANDDEKAVNLSDEVMARHSDPNLAVPDPKCV